MPTSVLLYVHVYVIKDVHCTELHTVVGDYVNTIKTTFFIEVLIVIASVFSNYKFARNLFNDLSKK